MTRVESQGVQFLRLVGRLHADNTLHLRPGYLTTNPSPIPEQRDSELVARLYDDHGELLLRYGVLAKPYDPSARTADALAVRCNIPFPPATQTIRFFRGEVMIHEIKVSQGKPAVKLLWKPRRRASGKETIAWSATHPENRPLQYFLRYTHSDGARWQGIATRLDRTQAIVDFGQLPGGERCRLAVLATDGVNTTTAESRIFSVPVKPYRAMILSPRDGSRIEPGLPCWFKGQGFILEEFRPELRRLKWISSIDGELGVGPILKVDKLSPGTHTITLKAGTRDRAGTQSVVIHVGTKAAGK
jgi:hypothetical protein